MSSQKATLVTFQNVGVFTSQHFGKSCVVLSQKSSFSPLAKHASLVHSVEVEPDDVGDPVFGGQDGGKNVWKGML
jgi:hypothetical protein